LLHTVLEKEKSSAHKTNAILTSTLLFPPSHAILSNALREDEKLTDSEGVKVVSSDGSEGEEEEGIEEDEVKALLQESGMLNEGEEVEFLGNGRKRARRP